MGFCPRGLCPEEILSWMPLKKVRFPCKHEFVEQMVILFESNSMWHCLYFPLCIPYNHFMLAIRIWTIQKHRSVDSVLCVALTEARFRGWLCTWQTVYVGCACVVVRAASVIAMMTLDRTHSTLWVTNTVASLI